MFQVQQPVSLGNKFSTPQQKKLNRKNEVLKAASQVLLLTAQKMSIMYAGLNKKGM